MRAKLSPLEKLERIDKLITDLEGEPLLIGKGGNVGTREPASLVKRLLNRVQFEGRSL